MMPSFTHRQYRELLAAMRGAGYTTHGFGELPRPDMPAPAILLRHDCDNDLVAATAMAAIESDAGVRSTYFLMLRSALYNLLSLPNLRLARQIVDGGHWIGLHFDEQRLAGSSPAEVVDAVDRERSLLAAELGVEVAAVSLHQPSRHALDGAYRLNCVNAYDRQDMAGFAYLSDSNMTWKEDPFEVVQEKRHPRLQLLIHPEWWTERAASLSRKWQEMLRHNFDLMQQSMQDRERAYRDDVAISFRRKRDGARR